MTAKTITVELPTYDPGSADLTAAIAFETARGAYVLPISKEAAAGLLLDATAEVLTKAMGQPHLMDAVAYATLLVDRVHRLAGIENASTILGIAREDVEARSEEIRRLIGKIT